MQREFLLHERNLRLTVSSLMMTSVEQVKMCFDILGIGSPLMDLLANVDDKILKELKVEKGGMFLVTDSDMKKIYSNIEKSIEKTMPGDSTANTIVGISDLGGKSAYIGKVGDDLHGNIFEKSLSDKKVKPLLAKSENMTGKVVALITPDKERTMIVYLGASKELNVQDIEEEDIKNAKFLHLTGYQLEEPLLKESSLFAMKIAKSHGIKISIDLADSNLIKRNIVFLKEIVEEYADIVFANEDEAKAFTEKEPREALDIISKMCEIAIVKIGKEGSYIKKGEEFHEIKSFEVETVDTTGAGDMYAAGILYGLSQDLSLTKCGKIGAYAASKIVSQIGARLETNIDLKSFL